MPPDSSEDKSGELLKPSNILNEMIGGLDEERKRIAHDLHDSLGCLLSTTSLLYDTVEPVNKERYDEVKALLNETRIELRRIVNNLMPATLEKLGLIPAIEQLCEQIGGAEKFELSFQCENIDSCFFSKSFEINIYRIIQELLNNVLKHGSGSKVELLLKYNKDTLYVYLKDNGNRLTESDFKKLSIRARVLGLGGEMKLNYCSKWTAIQVELPVAKF